MASLYGWLRYIHLLALAVFLLSHGVSGGAGLAIRSAAAPAVRSLLRASRVAGMVSLPALAVLVVTGVWMGFMGSWWGRGWIWASITLFVVVLVAMGFVARPYYLAREAASRSDDALMEQLRHTRPVAAVWIGGTGILALLFLMTFRPF